MHAILVCFSVRCLLREEHVKEGQSLGPSYYIRITPKLVYHVCDASILMWESGEEEHEN